jgi:hypothetical protein
MANENTKLYKGRTKTNHDKNHTKKEFHVGQKVWTYKSRLQLLPGKFKYKWFGPCIITKTCFLKELWRSIVHRKIKHLR